LVTYAYLAIGALQLFQELGFSSALIYRRDRVEEAASTTFIVVLVSSVVLYAVAWLSAPLVAALFRNEALVQVLRVLSITIVISAISQVPMSLLAKGMGFRNQVIPELIAIIVGSVLSVALAVVGYGVWALVYGQIVTSALISVLVWFFCPWRPSFAFAWRMAKELWDYGKHMVGFQVMVFMITNIDNAFVGRFMNSAVLGVYGLAYDLSNLPATHLSRIVGQVMFPAFTKVQEDAHRLEAVFFKSVKFVALVAFPVSVVTLVFAREFIVVAYGSKWYLAVLPLQLLTIYGLARSIAVNMGNVFKAGGKPNWLLYIATVRLALMAALLYPAIKWRGIDGVAGLSAVVAVADFILSAALTNRILHASWKRYVAIFLPMLLTSLVTAALGYQVYRWTMGHIHPFISLPLAGGIALALHLAIMYLWDPEVRLVASQVLGGMLREFQRVRIAHEQTRV
jgi:O-antigen/teichoic acid export membrane protein